MAAINTNPTGGVDPRLTGEVTGSYGRDITGKGLLAGADKLPTDVIVSYSAILSSISKMMPEMSSDMQDLLLAELTDKMREIQLASANEKIELDQGRKRDAIQEKGRQLKEADQKQEEAQKAADGASLWDKIKLAFQYIAAALAIVTGAILMTIPGFQAIGALTVMAGVLALIQAIDATVTVTTGQGVFGHIGEAITKGDEEAARILDTIFKIGAAVVSVALAVGMCFVPGGQAAALASMVKVASTIANAAIAIASAAGDVTGAVLRFSAAELQASGLEMQADAKKMDALLVVLDDLIDMAMQFMMNTIQGYNEILDSLTDKIKDRVDTLLRMQFGG